MAKSYEEILKELQEQTKKMTYTSVENRNISISNSSNKENYESAKNKTKLADEDVRNSVRTLTPLTISNNPFRNREELITNRNNLYKNQEKINEVMKHSTAQEIGMKLMSAPQEALSRKEELAKQYQNSYDFKNSVNEGLKNSFKEKSENAINLGIEESWAKYTKDLEDAQNKNYNLWDKTGGRLFGGMLKTASLKQGPQVKDENGSWYNLPTTQDITQNAIREQTDNSLLRFTGDVLYNTGRIATSAVLNKVIPGVGSTAYFSSMYMDNYNNARQNGYDDGKAGIYSTISTATELLTEKLLGGTTKAITGGKASALNQGIANGLSKIMNNKGVIKVLSHAGAEATEEFLQEYIDNVTKNIVLGENNNIFSTEVFSDALYSAAVGAATGSFGSIGDNSLDINTKKDLQQNNNNNAILPNANTLNSLQSNNQESQNVILQNNNSTQQENNSIFSKQIDEVLNGTYPKTDMLVVSESTPQILRNLGLKDLPITMTQKHLDTIMNKEGKYSGANYHNLGIDVVKQLPEALSRPLNVLKSSTKDNSIVVVTDLSDKNNNIVIASIAIDGKGQINDIKIDSNVMTSAYGKNNYDIWMQKNKDNIIYDIDEGIKKGDSTRIQYPRSTTPKSDVTDRFQLPMRNSSKEVTSDIPKNISPISYKNDNINLLKSQNSMLSFTNNMPNNDNNTQINVPYSQEFKENNKTLNPIEISNLTPNDANTTPTLPNIKRNKTNDGDSKYWNNILEKTDMLTLEQKNKVLSDDEVKYYDKVTNEESLNTAFERLNKSGANETINWFQKDSIKADSTDVAEGWILLKQYADNGNYDGMVEVAKKMRDIGSKAGQTIQAFNIMERMTPEGMVKYAQSELTEAYNQMVKNKSKEWIDKYRNDFDLKPQEVQLIMENMKEISTMKDGYDKRVKLAEIQKIMTDKLPPQKGSKIKSWMRMSMLFNPKTQVRNVAGNAIIAPVNYFGDLFSSYADKIVSKKTGVRTTGNMNVKAILKGFKEGAYEATNDYKKGINTKDMEGNRFEIGEGKSFSDKNIIGRNLNRVEGLLNYVMDVGDRMFSQSSFENSLQNQMVLNNTTEITQDMINIAQTESLQRTWNDNNNYTKFVLGIRRMLNRIGTENYGLGDILIPFAKTPANLTKAIVDYSPAGLVNTLIQGNNLRKSLNNGQYTPQMQHKFVQSLGKATAGTMLYVAGIALAKAGISSGESDDDKDTTNFLKNTLGISSYSIKIGNKSFTYDWAQPLAAPFSITANIVNSKNKDTALLESIIGNLDTAGSILLEQSFLTSLNEVLNSNDGVVSGLEKQILDLPARAVPTFSKQIADLVDGTQRTSYEYDKPVQSAINSIKAKIPGLSKTLAPSVDTLGREIKKYGGKNNIFNVFLNPSNVNTENISESAKEIYRLYKETGDSTIMPRVASSYVNKKGQKIIFTSEQKSEYQKKSGKIVEENLQKLLNSTEYKKMQDKEKVEIVKDIVNYSYNIAQKEILGTELSQTYQKAYEYSKIGNISDYYTFKNNIDESNKKESISNYLISSNLNDKQLAFLYGNYYSSEETLNNLIELNIPIKEFIKLNSEDIQSDYNSKNGQAVSGSKKKKVMEYVNSLNLNIPQKAILIKTQYNSFKTYDKEIVNYINELNKSSNEKKVLLKSIGFDNYDKDVVNYINSQNMSAKDKEKKLKSLGFTIRNGKVYY